MKKLLLLIALGFVMLSSCNNGQTKGAAEEIDSIALRAKTDTVLSFNGHTLGDSIIEEIQDTDTDTYSTFDKNATITINKCTYNVEYLLSGDIVKSVKNNHKIINTKKVDCILLHVGGEGSKLDSTDLSRFVKLFTSRYGKYSYYDAANDNISPVLFPNDNVDSLSHNYYLKTFISKRKGRIAWEWANCDISIYTPDNFEECYIEYTSLGAKYRLKKENKLKSKAISIKTSK